MGYQHILYERRNRVGIVTLNRPEVRNAQSRLLLEEMDAAFKEAAADDEVRCIILAGAGDHFSSGHDLGTPEERADWEARPWPEGARGVLERSWTMFVENSLRWRELPKPTIAQVQGYCIYGGFLIASVMDLIVAADDARFLPAHLQLFNAAWDLGVRKGKEILFEGRFIEAPEALELGLVNRVVPRAKLEEETFAQAERIAKTDRLTLRMLKFSINQMQDAQGYRTMAQAAHSNYMVLALGGRVRRGEPGEERRLPGVARALEDS